MPVDITSVGQRIRHVRETRGMSIGDLATKAGLAKSYVAKLERGDVDNPGVRTLASIAVALRITVGALLRTPTNQDLNADDDQAEADLRLAEQFGDAASQLPVGLRELSKKREMDGRPLSAHVLNALALVQFRGKRPKSAEDWEFLLYALERSTSRR